MIDRPLQPPKGFRKPIPASVKVEVVRRQGFRCAACGNPLDVDKTLRVICEFDHRPALTARGWSSDRRDTIPPANDPLGIEALHPECHAPRTVGDVKVRAKTIRRQRAADAHEKAMAEKAPGRPRPRTGSIRGRNTLRKRP